MTELFRHIGPSTDVPPATSASAAASWVPLRTIQAAQNEFTGVLTGGDSTGASIVRKRRIRRGLFRRGNAGHAERRSGQDLPVSQWQRCAIPVEETARSRREARHALRLGRLLNWAGIDREKLAFVLELKNIRRRESEYADIPG